MSHLIEKLAAAAVLALAPHWAAAAPLYSFSTADAALPAVSGSGLNGSVWTGVDVDSLSAARTYASGNPADATFTATTVDYPNGAAGSTSTSSTLGARLASTPRH